MKRLARGELEALVMNTVWDTGDWITARELQEIVSTSRRPLAYTTVMTILVRLWEKGMLERRPLGRAFVYQAVASREEWAARRMYEVLETSGDSANALHHFADFISTREAAQLRRALEGRKKR